MPRVTGFWRGWTNRSPRPSHDELRRANRAAARVCRGDYIVFDRQQLEYLRFIEKFHCTYCAYGAGLIAYVGENVARTEQYFCPIKHARKVLGTHRRYANFLDYGDADDYESKLEKFRVALTRHN